MHLKGMKLMRNNLSMMKYGMNYKGNELSDFKLHRTFDINSQSHGNSNIINDHKKTENLGIQETISLQQYSENDEYKFDSLGERKKKKKANFEFNDLSNYKAKNIDVENGHIQDKENGGRSYDSPSEIKVSVSQKTDIHKSSKEHTIRNTNSIKENTSIILYKEFLEHYDVISYHNTLRVYDGKAYIAMGLEDFLTRVLDMVECPEYTSKLDIAPSFKQIQEAYRFLSSRLSKIDSDVLRREDNDKNLIAFSNCLFDAYEQNVYKHSASKLTLFSIKANYINGDVETPEFDHFLSTINEGENWKKLKKLILCMIGYCMCYNFDGKCFFYLGTEHDAGKSVLGAFIQELFYENAIANTPINDLNSRFSLGSLNEKAICISMDLSASTMKSDAVARLKNITGDRRIHTEEKFMQAKSTYHNCKFIFGSNYPLRVQNSDDAFWSRVVLIPFTKSIPKKDQDKNLLKKLLDERDEIATLAARSLKKLVDNNFIFPTTKVSRAMLTNWRNDKCKDIVRFVEECCVLEDGIFGFTEELYRGYSEYCNENLLNTLSKIEFSKRLNEQFDLLPSKRRREGNSCHGYYGIGLNSNDTSF